MKKVLLSLIIIIGFFINAIGQVPSNVPTNGLVGYWPFNGNANDISGNGNNGIVNGATLVADRFNITNKAYSFDGVNDYITIPPSTSLYVDTFSISCWIKPNNINAILSSIIKKGTYSNATNEAYFLGLQAPNGIFSGVKDGTNCTPGIGWGEDLRASNNSLIGNWTNIVYIYSNGTLSIFVNGTFLGSVVIGGKITFCGNTEITIGMEWLNHYPFDGVIDDIGIWNRTLTQNEISVLFSTCQLEVKTQPISQTFKLNANAQFNVGSSDTSAKYRWQTDLGVGFQNLNSVGQYSGTNNDTLIISNVTMNNNNQPFRCIISKDACVDTSNIVVLTVNNNVGINDIIYTKKFFISPNPTTHTIHIDGLSTEMNNSAMIYSIQGQLLKSIPTIENAEIDLSDLAPGIYLIKINDVAHRVVRL